MFIRKEMRGDVLGLVVFLAKVYKNFLYTNGLSSDFLYYEQGISLSFIKNTVIPLILARND